jgi:hypothetical protein
LRLRNANAVDIGNDVVAYDANLTLFADFSRDRRAVRNAAPMTVADRVTSWFPTTYRLVPNAF